MSNLTIFYILFPFLMLVSFFGENIFSILGDQWAEAGVILKYFTIFILLKNIYSPISHIGDILNKQKLFYYHIYAHLLNIMVQNLLNQTLK